MLNPFEEINWKPSVRDLRRFSRRTFLGCLSAAAVASLAVAFHWPGSAILARLRLGMLALSCIGLAGMFWPAVARPLHRAVNGSSALFTCLVSNSILAVFYFLFLTPYAMCLRARRRDPLRLRLPPGKSQWQDHKPAANLRQYYRQY